MVRTKKSQSHWKGKIARSSYKQQMKIPLSERSEKHKKQELDSSYFERQFLMGIIVSNEFCAWARQQFSSQFLECDEIRRVVDWVYEYFDEYGEKAPGSDIQELFNEKKGRLNEAVAEYIEEVLDSISSEYSDLPEFNVSYWKARASREREKQIIKEKFDTVTNLIDDNRLEDAVEALQFSSSISDGKGLIQSIQSCLISSSDFIQRKLDRPRRLLRPWLAEGSLTLIYSPRGVGKTWLSCIIAMALTREEQEEITIGTWEAKHKAGVLLIDAEMNNYELQENIKGLAHPLPPEDPDNPLIILSAHDYAQEYSTQLDISKKEIREAIYKIFQQDKRIKVLILDNASALTPGIDENTKEDWDHINQWLISLRHLGIATILIHHAGKGGQQRGTSSREDAMDTIIKLELPKEYDHAKDYAWFKISFDKARNLQPGDSKAPFTIRIIEHYEGGLTWEVKDVDSPAKDKENQIIVELINGTKNKEIAEMVGCTPGYVTQIKTEAKRKGFLDQDGKSTEAGQLFVKEHEVDG